MIFFGKLAATFPDHALDNPFVYGSNPARQKPALRRRKYRGRPRTETGAANGKRTGASHGDFAS
jgi:hypothetical protein